jgi:hypothetical protein
MQMCKAKNASHIRTASTAAAEYPKAKTTNRRLHKIFDTTERTLSSSVCTSNDGQSRAAHRPEADASTPPRASALCACSSSSRRRSSATFALAPAASLCAISSQSTGMAIVYYCWIARDDVKRADSMPCLHSQKTSHPPIMSTSGRFPTTAHLLEFRHDLFFLYIGQGFC